LLQVRDASCWKCFAPQARNEARLVPSFLPPLSAHQGSDSSSSSLAPSPAITFICDNHQHLSSRKLAAQLASTPPSSTSSPLRSFVTMTRTRYLMSNRKNRADRHGGQCYFWRLPLEIRFEIYGMAYGSGRIIRPHGVFGLLELKTVSRKLTAVSQAPKSKVSHGRHAN
jgi:hypothetical protein